MPRSTPTPTTISLWSLTLLGLAVLQFPGILFYHDVTEPRIFGMPFIYGFNMLIWAFLCLLLYIAYRVRWGRPRPEELEGESRGDLERYGVDESQEERED